jgi:hypothetical protein
LDREGYLPFCRDSAVEMAGHRASGLDRGGPVAKVPSVGHDRCAAGAPVTVEGDQISRWDTRYARLVSECGKRI